MIITTTTATQEEEEEENAVLLLFNKISNCHIYKKSYRSIIGLTRVFSS